MISPEEIREAEQELEESKDGWRNYRARIKRFFNRT